MVKRSAFNIFAPVLAAFSRRAYAQVAAKEGGRAMLFCTIFFGVMWAVLWGVAAAVTAISYGQKIETAGKTGSYLIPA
jgi:hypothetical protein